MIENLLLFPFDFIHSRMSRLFICYMYCAKLNEVDGGLCGN